MNVDGKRIAEDILDGLKHELREQGIHPHLTVFTCAPTEETKQFLRIKKRRAVEVGIDINVVEFLDMITTDDVIASVKGFVDHTNGIVIQLPFPKRVDIDAVIDAIPPSHDVDALRADTTTVLSPVAGAIEEILKQHGVAVTGANAVVVGAGRLVGRPVAAWLRSRGAVVTVVTEEDQDKLHETTKEADILVLGAGEAGLIRPEHIKEGAIVLDAGTSGEAGVLRGDADPLCAQKASLFTPVPGGVGPITVAILLKNLVTLAANRS